MATARSKVPQARFFYALRPDRAAADELATLAVEAAERWGGHPFAAPDIHLTLAFVGTRRLEERPTLEAILRGLPRRFEASDAPADGGDDGGSRLALSRLGSFGRGVLWIGPPADEPRAPPAGTFAHRLAHEIRARLRAARIDFDDRPLQLHATLVRGAKTFGRPWNAGGSGDAGTREPAPRRIVARTWSLALGASGADSTPQHRYRWTHPGAGGKQSP
ncbi:MAG: hypothetical protein M9885_14040 [Burkholderiaceae bacterium]|nr:hypothetical protein [Burkholderiaceae bacterium]